MRGYCECCPDCVDKKLDMMLYDFADRPHPVIGRFGLIRGTVPVQMCGRRITLGFFTRKDFEDMVKGLEQLYNRCIDLRPRQEHLLVAFWSLFGGPVLAEAPSIVRLSPLDNATEIARRMPRLSLTAGQVRRRLGRVSVEVQAIQRVMQAGIIIPETREQREELEWLLWERYLRARAHGRTPLLNV